MNRFYESFDHYTTLADRNLKGAWVGGSSIVAGRNGNGMQVTGTGAIFTPASLSGSTRIIGAAYRTTGFANTVLHFNSSSIGVGLAAWLIQMGDGRLRIDFGGSSAVSTFVMSINHWYFFEFKEVLTFNPGPPSTLSGSFTARANGQIILTHNGTVQTSISDMGSAVFEGPGGGNHAIIDDFYYNDGSGSRNNDFMGDALAKALLPTADGSFLGWTPSSGSAHFAVIDEIPPNGDTDYLASLSPPQSDSHTVAAVTHASDMPLVQLHVSARDEAGGGGGAGGAQQINHIYKKGAGLDIGPNVDLAAAYAFYKRLWETNPVTALPWVGGDISGGEFGEQRIT